MSFNVILEGHFSCVQLRLANARIGPRMQAETKMHIHQYSHDKLLNRDEAAEALADLGYPVRSRTLATMATRGGGPLYQHFGVRPLYRWGDVLEWAHKKLNRKAQNTQTTGGG